MDEDFDEFHKANISISKGQYGAAEDILQLGLKKAKEKGSSDIISFYLFSLGYLYSSQNKNSEALEFYEEAYKASDDYYTKLNYARLLISIYNNDDFALEIVEEALRLIPARNQALNQAYSIMGLCFLKKGDRVNALEAFNKSVDVDFSQFKSSDSFDLTLVSELLNQKIHNENVDGYLAHILKMATEENNTHLVNLLKELISKD